MHVTRLTVKRFVLQARRGFGGRGQFALDSRPGERLDGAHAGPRLQHRLVLRTCRLRQEAVRDVNFMQPGGKVRSEVHVWENMRVSVKGK